MLKRDGIAVVFIGSGSGEASSRDAAAKGREQRTRTVAESHGSAAASAGPFGPELKGAGDHASSGLAGHILPL